MKLKFQTFFYNIFLGEESQDSFLRYSLTHGRTLCLGFKQVENLMQGNGDSRVTSRLKTLSVYQTKQSIHMDASLES